MVEFKRTGNLCTKSTIVAILVAILFVSVCAEDPHKRSYKILEGDNFLVICNITDSNDTDVYWTKNDTKHPFKMEGKRLEILSIKRVFSGDYICHALNTSYPEYNDTDANRTVQVINIDVQYPGEIDQFSAGPSVLLENSTFSISCDFQGNPAPHWLIGMEGGRDLMEANLPAGASMTSKATCTDTGFWQCTGHNRLNHGVNATRKQHITVHCPPRPQFEGNQYIVQANVGHSAYFVMNLLSNPTPNYTWTKDDGTDISGFTTQDDYSNVTRLTFNMVTIPAFGNYTLKMQNQYGTYYAQYQLNAHGTPETPKNFRFSDVTYNSVKLYWTSGFDMGSKQHFLILKLDQNSYSSIGPYIYDTSTNHGINQNWTYVLHGLVANTFYNLTIASENEFGLMSSRVKPSIYFWTPGPPPVQTDERINITLIVGLVCGSVGFIGVAAFLVYIIKYRRLRTSYLDMSEKPRKF